jgi:hypothetical protein
MRSKMRIATLTQISLVMGVLTFGMMRAPAPHRLRRLTIPIGRYDLRRFIGP